MRVRTLQITLFLLAAGFLFTWTQPALAQAGFCTVTQLTRNEDLAFRPGINDHGDIVWMAFDGTDREIYLFSAADGTITQLSDNLTRDDFPRINESGDVVWVSTNADRTGTDIFLYEAATGMISPITDDLNFEEELGFNNNGDIVWKRSGDAQNTLPSLRLYEAATKEITILSPSVGFPNPGIKPVLADNGDVAWGDVIGDREIVLSRKTDRALGLPPVNMSDNGNGSDSGQVINAQGDVAWNFAPAGIFNVFLYDASNSGITNLSLIPPGYRAGSPIISDNGDVAWQGISAVDVDTGVIVYRAATGTVTDISGLIGQERPSAINANGDVVWSWTDPADFRRSELFLYDAAGGESIQLSDNTGQALLGVLNNHQEVVWNGGPPTTPTSTPAKNLFLYSRTNPVVDAGADGTVHPGGSIVLSGSGSCDPNGDLLSYRWTIVDQPPGSAPLLSGADTLTPTFTADPDAEGDYVIHLNVITPTEISFPGKIILSTTNTAPVANAGPDQAIDELGATVTLDGSGSSDFDGDSFTFAWTLVSAPLDSTASFGDTAAAERPTFVADQEGAYIASLVVTDKFGISSAPDTVAVSFNNLPPVADAGGNHAIRVGIPVLVDGSGSFDPNLDPTTYSWSLVSLPDGGGFLGGADTESPSLFPNAAGTYVLQLVVSDALLDSEPDTATIVAVSNFDEGAIATLIFLIEALNNLPGEDYRTPAMKNGLTNTISAILRHADEGRIETALRLLETAVVRRANGCAVADAPDRDDWLVTCEAQEPIYQLIQDAIEFLNFVLNPPGGGGGGNF